MPYGEPTHGWWCNARTYPTRCKYCKEEVFYFSCDCGSKVFFDDLGWPWPIHNCMDVDQIVEQVRIDIQEDYAQGIAEREKRRRERTWEAPIKAQQPREGERVEDIGIVREILEKVDVFKKFNLPADSIWSTKLLGELGSNDFMQVTVHVNDLSGTAMNCYTFLVRQKLWDRLGAVRGDLLSFELVGRSVPGGQVYWLCAGISWPG